MLPAQVSELLPNEKILSVGVVNQQTKVILQIQIHRYKRKTKDVESN